jgi:tRNA (guanine-N7-)-methyltransferase
MVRINDPASPEGGADSSAPRIRSFVVRAGRIGPGQARALATLAPRFVVPFVAAPVDFARVFGRVAPLAVEIGFGMIRPLWRAFR